MKLDTGKWIQEFDGMCRSVILPTSSTFDDQGMAENTEHRWTFLSNHAHVLICLAQDPDIRLRDVAAHIGITECAVQNILTDLESEGLVERHREGRRNTYALHLDKPLRHPIEGHRKVGDLVRLILE